MPTYSIKCPNCGPSERVSTVARRNDPCTKCGSEVEREWVANGFQTYQDDIPGGLLIENLGPEPVRVYSHTERLALARSRGLEPYVKHAPMSGGDKSPHTIKWDATPVSDPRPISMLSVEERRARRVEAAERLGVTVEVLEVVSGPVETMGAAHSTDDDDDRTGGEFAARVIRNQEVRVPSVDEVRGVMEVIEYPNG